MYSTDARYKIGKSWEPAVQHRELYSKLCDGLNGKEMKIRGVYVYI